ncbi:Uncharacterized protein Adt_05844 [Abeliophyllum distichum]|uniref:Uncharacterized protein n=1 Tax=Abeliophyllum distichum TaxID=126358 RepID=A0ABD1V6H8_9LAMI
MATSKRQFEDRVGVVEARIEEMYGGMQGEMGSIKNDLGQLLGKLMIIEKIEQFLEKLGANNNVEYRSRVKRIQPESSNTPTHFHQRDSGENHRRELSPDQQKGAPRS